MVVCHRPAKCSLAWYHDSPLPSAKSKYTSATILPKFAGFQILSAWAKLFADIRSWHDIYCARLRGMDRNFHTDSTFFGSLWADKTEHGIKNMMQYSERLNSPCGSSQVQWWVAGKTSVPVQTRREFRVLLPLSVALCETHVCFALGIMILLLQAYRSFADHTLDKNLCELLFALVKCFEACGIRVDLICDTLWLFTALQQDHPVTKSR